MASTSLSIINATPYTWFNLGTDVGPLNDWAFPASIIPGEITEVYISASKSVTSGAGILAIANYSVVDPQGLDLQFYLQGGAGTSNGPELWVNLAGISTINNPKGSQIQLGFDPLGPDVPEPIPFTTGDQIVPFILAGDRHGFASNNPPDDWMHASLDRLGCQTLRHLCIPGSHDAGMSEFHDASGGALAYDVVTQHLNIYDQLRAGVRFLDLRPIIAGGHYQTGHYSGSHGGYGQSMLEVINEINAFTANNQELIVITFSSSSNTDQHFRTFDQTDWNGLMTLTNSINHLYQYGSTVPQDLTSLLLSDFIENSAAVILVNLDGMHDLTNGKGWYNPSSNDSGYFPTTGSYANTPVRSNMRKDQFAKLVADRTSPDDEMFQLFWTLTEFFLEILALESITDFADIIYPDLFQSARDAGVPQTGPWSWQTNMCYPNIITIDDVHPDRWLTSLAIAISYFQNPNLCHVSSSTTSSTTQASSTTISSSSTTSSSCTLSSASSSILPTSSSCTSSSASLWSPPSTTPCWKTSNTTSSTTQTSSTTTSSSSATSSSCTSSSASQWSTLSTTPSITPCLTTSSTAPSTTQTSSTITSSSSTTSSSCTLSSASSSILPSSSACTSSSASPWSTPSTTPCWTTSIVTVSSS